VSLYRHLGFPNTTSVIALQAFSGALSKSKQAFSRFRTNGFEQMGSGFGFGFGPMGPSLGLGFEQMGSGFGFGFGPMGSSLGLGFGQMGSGFGFGFGPMGPSLGLGFEEMGSSFGFAFVAQLSCSTNPEFGSFFLLLR